MSANAQDQLGLETYFALLWKFVLHIYIYFMTDIVIDPVRGIK